MPDHSLPTTDTGDKGPAPTFMVETVFAEAKMQVCLHVGLRQRRLAGCAVHAAFLSFSFSWMRLVDGRAWFVIGRSLIRLRCVGVRCRGFRSKNHSRCPNALVLDRVLEMKGGCCSSSSKKIRYMKERDEVKRGRVRDGEQRQEQKASGRSISRKEQMDVLWAVSPDSELSPNEDAATGRGREPQLGKALKVP